MDFSPPRSPPRRGFTHSIGMLSCRIAGGEEAVPRMIPTPNAEITSGMFIWLQPFCRSRVGNRTPWQTGPGHGSAMVMGFHAHHLGILCLFFCKHHTRTRDGDPQEMLPGAPPVTHPLSHPSKKKNQSANAPQYYKGGLNITASDSSTYSTPSRGQALGMSTGHRCLS